MRLAIKALALLVLMSGIGLADDNVFFKYGPLELNIPLKTVKATYLYDFQGKQSLVGGETPIANLWQRIEGTVGAVTSTNGEGTPFVGGNILIGNLIEKWVTLPPDFAIGFYGGYNFRTETALYGPKASLKIW